MKSPADLRTVLIRQWHNADRRVSRMLAGGDAWPVDIPIGLPSAKDLVSRLDKVKRHVEQWRAVSIGEVLWSERSYRSTATAIRLPTHWRFEGPGQWVRASGDREITSEFDFLSNVLATTDSIFHDVLVRRRSLWRGKTLEAVALASRVAMQLSPGYAEGRPLRLLSLSGHAAEVGPDTKFFERHRRLLTTLLDQRFDGEVSLLGLEAFLNALTESDHWLLLVDLDGGLLPFQKQRVRSSELLERALPCERIIIIENETCQHLLPALPGTIAVLGSGFDLDWTAAGWLRAKQVAYWGDLDTWGLVFLAKVRRSVSHVQPLMMDQATYRQHIEAAVPEPVSAPDELPGDLTESEQSLYTRLRDSKKRLEQEFILPAIVTRKVHAWANG
ncbi:MAG: DUF2399 domain-containing protein [Planctomycetaceae bacterium]|nr:DUF2399 domain-containing protein [Planctomycetales bacterium]MCB9921400.1 DUF2399 domain-containing protein [Planctomycetaceae bacterium]